MKIIVSSLFAALVFACSPLAQGDEGLYLFSNPPRQQLKEKYQFDLPDSMLQKLQKASVFFEDGSASFVSANGLILTNQHVGWRWLEELTTAKRDLVRNGFCAQQHDDEIPCPGLEARIMSSMEDVTARIHAAIKPDMSITQAYKAREAEVRAIEKESADKTGLFSEVVALDQGGRYQLYRYAKYTDIRLVFAPERDVLRVFDVCFFRAYEEGRPARIKDFLSFATTAPQPGELVLLSGFPGATSRFRTASDIEAYYGRRFFLWFKHLGRWQNVVADFCQQSPDNDRLGRLECFGLENEFSSELFLWHTLEKQLAKKRAREKSFAESFADNPQLTATYQQAHARIANAFKNEERLDPYFFLEHPAAAFNSDLFHFARRLLRLADEAAKPDADRLWEYCDSHRENTEHEILAPKTIAKELEILKLASSLSLFADRAGADAELLKKILAGKTPEQRARELVTASRLDDLAVRKALVKGGIKAVAEADDAMIDLARLVDARAREARAHFAETVNEPTAQAYADLARVRAKVLGEEAYPDATGSLRLSFGKVQPFAGMYGNTETGITRIGDVIGFIDASHQSARLPMGWQKAREGVDFSAALLVSSSADAVSGNSGSPVVNREGRLLGVCSIGAKGQELSFEEGRSGCGTVAAQGILEMLDKAYDAKRLVQELGGNAAPQRLASATSAQLPPLPSLPPLPPTSFMPVSIRTVQEPPPVARFPKELVPALVNSLKDIDNEVVQAAAQGLSILGNDALPALIESLQSKEEVQRANAALVIGKMGPFAQSAIPALIKCLQDRDVQVRREAARALAALVVEAPSPRVASEWPDLTLPVPPSLIPVPAPLIPMPPPIMPMPPQRPSGPPAGTVGH